MMLQEDIAYYTKIVMKDMVIFICVLGQESPRCLQSSTSLVIYYNYKESLSCWSQHMLSLQ